MRLLLGISYEDKRYFDFDVRLQPWVANVLPLRKSPSLV